MKGVDNTKTPFAIYRGSQGDSILGDKEWEEMAVKHLGSRDLAERMIHRLAEMAPDRRREVKKALLEHWQTLEKTD